MAAPLLRLTRGGWVPDASDAMAAAEAAGVDTYCEWRNAEGWHGGVTRWGEEEEEEAAEAMVAGAAFVPLPGEGPLFYFSLEMDIFIGGVEARAEVDGGERAVEEDADEEEEAMMEAPGSQRGA